MTVVLGVGRGAARAGVAKVVAAAEVLGVSLSAVPAAQLGLTIQRLPALQDGALQLFGEHAICRYLGRLGNQAAPSLDASDWLELDARASLTAAPADLIESRLSARGVGTGFLDSQGLGVADVCVACTLLLEREKGVELGPASAAWAQHMYDSQPKLQAGLVRARGVLDSLMVSYMDMKFEQAASLPHVLGEACEAALAQVIGSAPVSDAQRVCMLADGRKQPSGSAAASPEFQINNAMSLVKALKEAGDTSVKSPRDVADKLQSALAAQDGFADGSVVARAETAGPGFINLFLAESFVSRRVQAILSDGRLMPPYTAKTKVGVDFSSPNVAKEMHVGHLRSTIIGEALCRMLEFCGHEVKRINHIGDWGTQFGMLLTYMRHNHPDFLTNPPTIEDLDSFYKDAKKAFDGSEDFKTESREEVVRLQQGDEAALAGWRSFLSISETMLFQVYRRLGVTFPDGLCGESFYNSRIPAVVKELQEKKMVVDEDGAQCVFTKAQDPPLFIVKRDGGYGYDSTDMAALKYRTAELGLGWIIYVTDLGQGLHFKACFEAAERAGWVDGVRLDHVGHGVVTSASGGRFRTRDGGTVRLVDLLDEAKDRMAADLRERIATGRTPLTEDKVDEAASKLGYSAVKYFDLNGKRENNYKFDYDAMLASDGDTAVYLIYSYARICSIESKIAAETGLDVEAAIARGAASLSLSRDNEAEWDLAIKLLRFPELLERATDELRPHHVCKYTHDLAAAFASFYSANKLLVRDADNKYMLSPERGECWLALVRAVKIALRDSLAVLSLEPLERV